MQDKHCIIVLWFLLDSTALVQLPSYINTLREWPWPEIPWPEIPSQNDLGLKYLARMTSAWNTSPKLNIQSILILLYPYRWRQNWNIQQKTLYYDLPCLCFCVLELFTSWIYSSQNQAVYYKKLLKLYCSLDYFRELLVTYFR